MSTVIRVENLGKKYLINHQKQARYTTLRDTISESASKIGKRLIKPFSSADKTLCQKEEFWALKNVSFEINQGDRIGIIGRNGAGKSTLLKLLCRITEPSTGKISIKGRIGSLLEVGTGFHPELTGRENIFLNGAILGMTRAEIKKKFDEIVEFAEVEKFLDTPVKRYSSGMYMRLAFSVAAHLEPEILIVDEVLAVGDVEFQKKCLGKMDEVGKNGRTVLFVSHDISAIEQLCNSIILLDKGQIISAGNNVLDIINKYVLAGDKSAHQSEWNNENNCEYENDWFKPTRFFIGDENGNRLEMPVSNDSDIWVYLEGEIKKYNPALAIGYTIFCEQNNELFTSVQTDEESSKWPRIEKGNITLRCKIPKRLLNDGVYRFEINASLYMQEWILRPGFNSPAIFLNISGKLSDSPYWTSKRAGVIAPVLTWQRVE